MRLLSGRGVPPEDQVQAARARVAAIGRRSGWVPRVPESARRREPPVGAQASTAPEDTTAVRQRAAGRHARLIENSVEEPASERSDVPVEATQAEPAEETATPRGPVGAAVSDHLPLLLRPLVEGLPAGVRHGRFGLQPSHALIIVLVILLGLAVTAILTGLGRPKVAAVQPAAPATVLATGTPVAESEPEREEVVIVHVVGKVGAPGIVELPAGSRVLDALEAVGGADEGVDLTTLNLARIVGDGEQIFVGVDPPPQAAARPEPGEAVPVHVDLNTATPVQLETLPGIGPTLANRIIQWRERHGRFTAVEELLEVSGIGPATYEAMAELVTL